MTWLIAAAVLTLQQEQQPAFESPNGAFVIFTVDRLRYEPAGLHAEATGTPLRLRLRDQGVELTAANGEMDAARTSEGNYYLTSATVSGSVRIRRDWAIADDYANEVAKKSALPAPKPNPTPTLTLTSEKLAYKGTAEVGTINLPVDFEMASAASFDQDIQMKGHPVKQHIEQTLQLRGKTGEVTFSTKAPSLDALQTGRISGPVWMRALRNSVTEAGPNQTSELEGTGDEIVLDFTGPQRTVTLNGHVTVTGYTPAYSGTSRADKAVVVFAKDGSVASIEMTGSPTQTQIKRSPRSGGKR